MRAATIALVLGLGLGLAGGPARAAKVGDSSGGAAVRPDAVPVASVVAAFEDVCIATAPDFLGAEDRFARHGLTRRADTGTVYHPSGTFSAKVQQVTQGGTRFRRCSMVYEDPDEPTARDLMNRAVERLGQSAGRGRTDSFTGNDGEPRYRTTWPYTAAGRTGTLLHVPYQGSRQLGVILLDFPAEGF